MTETIEKLETTWCVECLGEQLSGDYYSLEDALNYAELLNLRSLLTTDIFSHAYSDIATTGQTIADSLCVVKKETVTRVSRTKTDFFKKS